MPDEEIVIRTRLEDAGVVPGLEQQARAVADLRTRAAAGGSAGTSRASEARAIADAERLDRVVQEAVERQRANRTRALARAPQPPAAVTRATGGFDYAADIAAVEQEYRLRGSADKERQTLLDRAKQMRREQSEERDIALATGTTPGKRPNLTQGLSTNYAGRGGVYGMLAGLGLDENASMGAMRLLMAGGGGPLMAQVGTLTSLRDVAGGLATKLGPAVLAVGGLTLGLGALAFGAIKTGIDLGTMALQFDTVAQKGAGAKTSIAQAADATQRLQLGVGRYTAPVVNAFNTEKAALISTVASAVGNQTLDDAVQNALARERAAQQRLEAGRKFWTQQAGAAAAAGGAVGPNAGLLAPLGQIGMPGTLGGMGLPGTAFLPPRPDQGAEAAAAAETTARLQAQLAQAQAALNAIQAGGGGPQTRAETGAFLTQQIAAKEKDVALIKEEVAQYQELARQITLAGQAGDTGLAQRLGEQFKTINVDKLLQALRDAEKALRDLTGRKYVLDIEAAIRVPTSAEVQAGMARANLNIFDPSRMQDWGPYAQNYNAPGNTYNSILGQFAPPEPLVPFNIGGAGIGDVAAYGQYQTGKANQGTAGVIAAAAASAEMTRSLAARDYVKPSNAIGKIESTLRGLIGQGPSTAVGLGDLRGGTYGGGPLAPGAGGPFEALYRIQDVAQNWDTPGKDTKKWAEMYGVDKEQAKGISKQFQMGFFSPEVMKHVDTQALVDTANMMDLADKSQEALAKELAKKGANPANIKRLLGVVGKDDKDTSQYKPAIDTMLGGLGTELGNQAGNVEAVGKKWWGLLEKGLTEGAKDSDVLLEVLRSLIRAEINSSKTVPAK